MNHRAPLSTHWIAALALLAGMHNAVSQSPPDQPPPSAAPEIASRRDSGTEFESALAALASFAAARPDGRLRVAIELEVELDPDDRSRVAERARRPAIEQRYNNAVRRSQDRLIASLRQEGIGTERNLLNRIEGLPFVSALLTPEQIAGLAKLPEVLSVSKEFEAYDSVLDTLPQVDADLVHWAGNTGAFRTIAVIDSGVQTNHPFFSARLVGGACYSTSDPGQPNICAGGVPSGTTTIAAGGSCTHTVGGAPDPACGHGTHVAGIALGSAAPYKGMAPSASLVSIQASSLQAAGCPTGSPIPCRRYLESDVANALMRVYALRHTHAFAAVNLSLGTGNGTLYSTEFACRSNHPLLVSAITALYHANIPVVAASGNHQTGPGSSNANGRMPVPACVQEVIAVGAVSKTDVYASYSGAHPTMLDLLAPGGLSGSQIVSSLPISTYGSSFGTSMAAAHVSGALALMRVVNPYASPRALTHQLGSSGPLIQVSYNFTSFYKHRLDADDALLASPPAGAMGPVTVTNLNCYGANDVSWSAVTGANEYHVEGAASASFSAPTLLAHTLDWQTSVFVEVPATRHIRVRACSNYGCGAWQVAGSTAQYKAYCL